MGAVGAPNAPEPPPIPGAQFHPQSYYPQLDHNGQVVGWVPTSFHQNSSGPIRPIGNPYSHLSRYPLYQPQPSQSAHFSNLYPPPYPPIYQSGSAVPFTLPYTAMPTPNSNPYPIYPLNLTYHQPYSWAFPHPLPVVAPVAPQGSTWPNSSNAARGQPAQNLFSAINSGNSGQTTQDSLANQAQTGHQPILAENQTHRNPIASMPPQMGSAATLQTTVEIPTPSATWVGWPDGDFSQLFTWAEYLQFEKLAVHWACAPLGGDKIGNDDAEVWEQGKTTSRRCNGVIKCNNALCMIIVRPQTRRAGIHLR
ncbi:hypothetical protein GALMADRAFT_275949 [Galerina marginata CBS 339.88]|uniref:Uncharacterized protein n=1 Tax=Galerina marginata (strain CBS 339.88) TaxID=685588 RepID=A0A067TIB9_GALM3|nr:hypothetical protein GALMADRAFT_275949 [Galerina marginata CBS 339.88]